VRAQLTHTALRGRHSRGRSRYPRWSRIHWSPTSVGSQSFPSRSTTTPPPSLHGHYPASSVLCSGPTPRPPFGSLALSRLSAILLPGERPGPPELTYHSHVRRAEVSDPGEAQRNLAIGGSSDVAFRPTNSVGLPVGTFRGSIPSASRLSARRLACLRLSPRVAPRDSKAGYRWMASPFRGGFPPPM